MANHTLNDHWITEIEKNNGVAFSLQMKKLLHEEQTPYQHIAIYDTETFGKLMLIDGCTMVSTRDNFLYHEMMSHPVLFTHPHPENVVIIGGGDCGTLREVLRHQTVKSAWQIEIDERVTRLAEKYFPELCESNHDPRAHLYFGDGVQWMADAKPDSIDVIIIDSTDPIGPAVGLFSEPFQRNCLKALRNGGIIVQQSESPLLHLSVIKSITQNMRNAGFKEVCTLTFPQTIYPSGWWSATMAIKNKSFPTFRDAKNFPTKYYNAAIHRAAFALPEFMREELLLNKTCNVT